MNTGSGLNYFLYTQTRYQVIKDFFMTVIMYYLCTIHWKVKVRRRVGPFKVLIIHKTIAEQPQNAEIKMYLFTLLHFMLYSY